MSKLESIAGVILAGGLSRRMGGGDKGLLDVGGTRLIGRVIDSVRPQVSHLAINANGPPDRFFEFGLPVIEDPIDGFVGPLAGVLAGMRWAETLAADVSHLLTVSSDAPFLPDDLAEQLRQTAKAAPDGAIVLAASDGQVHPVIGLWPVRHADDLESALKEGVRKVLRWTDRHGTVQAAFEPQHIGAARVDPFFNANTPEELQEARDLIAAQTLASNRMDADRG